MRASKLDSHKEMIPQVIRADRVTITLYSEDVFGTVLFFLPNSELMMLSIADVNIERNKYTYASIVI